MERPNKPVAPNAGIASRLTIEDHWPGVGEPGRWPLHTFMKTDHRKIGFTIAGRLLIVSAMLVAFGAHAEDQVGGIGVWMVVKNDVLTIANVTPDTPAWKAGLVPGLVIQKIDGIATSDKRGEDCVAMIRGTIGTTVKLELVDTAHSKTNTVELTRAEVKP